MRARIFSFALMLGFVGALWACQDGGVVAPDTEGLSSPELVTTFGLCDKKPDHPNCTGGGGDDPGVNASLLLTGAVSSDLGQDPHAHILVNNTNKFVAETPQDPVHGLTQELEIASGTCEFTLPEGFIEPGLDGDEQGLEPFLKVHRIATVIVLHNRKGEGEIRIFGKMESPYEEQERDIRILLRSPSATRESTVISFLPVHEIWILFPSSMGGGSVVCNAAEGQDVIATFTPL